MNSLAKLISSLGLGASLALCPCCSTMAQAEAPPAQATQSATSVTLKVEGMTCASCAAKVTPQQMVDAINKAGYRGSLPAPKGS